MRTLAIAFVVVGAATVSAGVAHAATPRIVIVSGKPIAHRIVISSWQSITAVVDRLENARVVPRTRLAHRPRLEVSMFWGPSWVAYLRNGRRASDLRPKQADQFGSFYPAWRGRPAAIDLPWAGRWPRAVPAKALAILDRFGVPTRLR